jgi:hypothetical protein
MPVSIKEFAQAEVVAVISLLRAHVDEFNDYTDETCKSFGMSGLIGPVHEWHKLQCKWEDALDCCRVKYFHATDLQAFEGEYRGWTQNQRERLLSMLVGIVQESLSNFRLLGSANAMSSYRYIPEYRRRLLRNPYYLAAVSVMSDGARFAYDDFGKKPVEFVFDQKTKHKHLIDDAYDEVLLTRWGGMCAAKSMASHKLVSPVQIADLLAYECKKYIESRLENIEPEDLRWPMEQLKEVFYGSETTWFNWHGLMLVTDFWGNYRTLCKYRGVEYQENLEQKKRRLRAMKAGV